jgi:hypothetical protein
MGARAAGGVEGAEGIEGLFETGAGAAEGRGGLGGELVLEGLEGVGWGHVPEWMPWPRRAARAHRAVKGRRSGAPMAGGRSR